MRYSLKQLEIFAHVAKSLNITSTAYELHMTPPGVHKHIANLEDICGIKLFSTTNRRLNLTQHGQQLYQSIQPLLREAALLNTNIKSLNKIEPKPISVSITNTFAKVFYKLIQQYSENKPFVEFKIEAPTWSDQHAHLSKSTHELYIFGEPQVSKKDYIIKKLFEFKMILVAPCNTAGKNLLNDPTKIKEAQFIFPCASGKTGDFQHQLFKKWDIKKTPHYFEGYASILDAVRAEIGIAFLPDVIVADDLSNKTLMEIPMKYKSFPMPVVISWKKQTILSEQATDFVNFLKEYFTKATYL